MAKRLEKLLKKIPEFSWNARAHYFTFLYGFSAGHAYQSFQNDDLYKAASAGIISLACFGIASYSNKKYNNERKFKRKITR